MPVLPQLGGTSRQPPLQGVAARLLGLHEGKLFWLLTTIGAGVTCGVGFVVWVWISHGFANIGYLKFTLFLMYAATVIGSLGMSLFHAHLLKRG
jgi:hypothetical protein